MKDLSNVIPARNFLNPQGEYFYVQISKLTGMITPKKRSSKNQMIGQTDITTCRVSELNK